MENEIQEETFFADNDDDVLSLDDLSGNFITNPKIGETVEFTSKKVKKITGKDLIVQKKDGGTFEKNLSKVDYGIEVITDTNAVFTVSSWEVWGKMKAIFQKLGKFDVSFRITHVLDGMKAENRKKDCYKVEALVDGEYKTLDRETKEWQ